MSNHTNTATDHFCNLLSPTTQKESFYSDHDSQSPLQVCAPLAQDVDHQYQELPVEK